MVTPCNNRIFAYKTQQIVFDFCEIVQRYYDGNLSGNKTQTRFKLIKIPFIVITVALVGWKSALIVCSFVASAIPIVAGKTKKRELWPMRGAHSHVIERA